MPDVTLTPAVGILSFFEEPEPEYDWLVPGLIERGDRMILTGNEGKGKSTLLRQVAIQLAGGLHPFTLEPIPPIKVMFVDLENGRGHVRREFHKFFKGTADDEHLKIASWPGGLDLLEKAYRTAFVNAVSDYGPDLLIIGPMYKLAPKLDREEESSLLAQMLDMMRATLKFSLILESHQPHALYQEAERIRPERPFGSSLWMRWPEFGFCLEDSGMLRPWRGARDADRGWPLKLARGEEWPWMVDAMRCAVCGEELEGKQSRYCSEKCSATGRKRDSRARQRA
jgi:hypothetical protein